MGLAIFTLIHILISLEGIVSGLVVLGGWLAGKHYQGWTPFFLVTTLATSVTGFFFPFRGFTPAYGVGVVSLFILAAAIYAPALWRLEQGIPYQRRHSSLPEFFRPCRTAIPENSRLEGTRANPDRTTLRDLAGHRLVAFCRARHRSGAPVPSRAHKNLRKLRQWEKKEGGRPVEGGPLRDLSADVAKHALPSQEFELASSTEQDQRSFS
jgi:hypothetical protein